MSNPLDGQVDGNHYKAMKIQPVEYVHANGLGFLEGNAIKYLSRWRNKNGTRDLEKAKHCIDLLIQLETQMGVSIPIAPLPTPSCRKCKRVCGAYSAPDDLYREHTECPHHKDAV